MAEKEKETIMVLKVDLQCHKCYKKVKKVLCKFPQIRDQIYDEKQNQVVIKVVCCSPEKIRDRICCKGGGAIKGIEIKEPEKPKPPPADKPKPPPADKPKPPEDKPKPPPADKPKPPPPADKPKPPPPADKPKPPPEDKPKPPPADKPKPPPADNPKPPPANNPKPPPPPVHDVPIGYPPPNVSACCMDCYHGHPGGPCQTGYGGAAPYIQYDGYYGRPVYDSYGGGRSYNTNYCVARSDCFSEENPQGCTVM